MLGGLVLGAGSSIASTITGNQAVNRQIGYTKRSARIAQSQAGQALTSQRQAFGRELSQIQGQLAVLSSEQGVAGNTVEARNRAALASEYLKSETAFTNYENTLSKIQIETQQSLENLSNQKRNPFVSGILGGFSGLQTGLQILQGLDSLQTTAEGKNDVIRFFQQFP